MQTTLTRLDRLLTGATVPYEMPSSMKEPEWLDKRRFRRGQAFVKNNLMGVLVSHFMGLMGVYFWPPFFRVLVYYRKYETIATLRRLNESAIVYIMGWYEGDLWNPQDMAQQTMKEVQEKHRRLGNYANKNSDKVATSVLDTTKEPGLLSGSDDHHFLTSVRDDLNSPGHRLSSICPFQTPERNVYMSQVDLAMAVLTTISSIVLFPEKIGTHYVSEEEMGDFIYVWRVLGYHLGIQDQFNPCAGSVQEVRDLCKEFVDRVAIPVLKGVSVEEEYYWRIMVKSVHRTSVFFYLFSWRPECIMLYLAWCIGIDDVIGDTYRKIPWYSALHFLLLRFYFTVICRFRIIIILANKMLRVTVLKWLKTQTMRFKLGEMKQ